MADPNIRMIELKDDVDIPQIGLGVYLAESGFV